MKRKGKFPAKRHLDKVNETKHVTRETKSRFRKLKNNLQHRQGQETKPVKKKKKKRNKTSGTGQTLQSFECQANELSLQSINEKPLKKSKK